MTIDFPELFTTDELLELKKIATPITYPQNIIVIKQSEYSDQFYYVEAGELEVFITNNEGKEKVINVLKKGEYFGELALLVDSIRNASVRTKSKCELLRVNKDEFNIFLDKHPNFCLQLLKIISIRLAKTLNIFAEQKKQTFIQLNYDDESKDRMLKFEEYFLSISPLKVVKTTIESFHADFSKYNEHNTSYYFLIRKHVKNEKNLDTANFTINFVGKNVDSFCLTAESSQWAIENLARRITKKTIGLALASGGAPGMAHIGVLNEFKKENIPIDFIVGSSAGSLFGAVFAFGYSFEQLLKIFTKEAHKSRVLLILRHFCFNFSGMVKNNYLKKILFPIFADSKIEDALIPFGAVSSDLYTGKTLIIKHGDTINALLASSAAPLLIEPVKYDNHLLIDGVATAPLPVRALYSEKMDIKVAVNIPQLDLIVSMKKKPTMLDVYLRSRSMMAQEMESAESKLADVLIIPKVHNARLTDWKNMERYIDAGREAALPAINIIKQHLRSAYSIVK